MLSTLYSFLEENRTRVKENKKSHVQDVRDSTDRFFFFFNIDLKKKTMTTATRKTSDMNTPNDPLANDDQHGQSVYTSMDNMSTRLSHYQIPRYEPRNYRKLLRESNVPAAWYQTAPPPCSIYFYDPQFQKYLHKRATPSNSPRKNVRFIFFCFFSFR